MKTYRFMFTAAPTSNITQKYDVKWSRIIWLNHVTVYSKYVKINETDVKQYLHLCVRSSQLTPNPKQPTQKSTCLKYIISSLQNLSEPARVKKVFSSLQSTEIKQIVMDWILFAMLNIWKKE